MAAKQVGRVFDWAAIANRLPKTSRAELASLRTAYVAVQTSLSKLSAEPQPIDWQWYKSQIKAPEYVDSLKAEYEALQFTYPEDKISAAINANEKEAADKSAKLLAEVDQKIASLKAQLAAVKAERPLEEVTVNEFLADKPEWRKEFDKETEKNNYL
eukprot:m.35135 g.35135  ORF g.35135 m.35135 type:complete len:157 (-) comp11249_c0_seq1:194-664(-)